MVYMIQRDGLKILSEVEDDLLSELHPQPMRRGLECAGVLGGADVLSLHLFEVHRDKGRLCYASGLRGSW